jgi:hypothetical protein
MKLPQVNDPTRYAGLYVVDFGGQVAVGYTASEVEVLMDHERYRGCRVYRIYQAYPDGRMELRGVDATRFQLEEGMLFYRGEEATARADYDALLRSARRNEPPCRCQVQLARLDGAEYPFVTALIFPAEYSDDISRWLLDAEYAGGTIVEGGVSLVAEYQSARPVILAREQLWWGTADGTSRPAEEVLASTGRAVQR